MECWQQLVAGLPACARRRRAGSGWAPRTAPSRVFDGVLVPGQRVPWQPTASWSADSSLWVSCVSVLMSHKLGLPEGDPAQRQFVFMFFLPACLSPHNAGELRSPIALCGS